MISAASRRQVQSRSLSCLIRSFSGIDVSQDHYKDEWKTYGDIENYNDGKFQIKTFNKVSAKGLQRFGEDTYDVRGDSKEAANAHAILLRSHKLKEEEVAHTVRAIARCDNVCYFVGSISKLFYLFMP